MLCLALKVGLQRRAVDYNLFHFVLSFHSDVPPDGGYLALNAGYPNFDLIIIKDRRCVGTIINICVNIIWGRDTAIKGGRSGVRLPMGSLRFFIDLIVPSTL